MQETTEKALQGIKLNQPKHRSHILLPPPPKAVADSLGLHEISIEWLAGDGSDRCYYRICSQQSDQSFVLMQLSQEDAKKIKNNGYEWIQIGQLLARHGMYVPRTVAILPNYAALIIEDYGNVMLENVIQSQIKAENYDAIYPTYEKVINLILTMIGIPFEKNSPWCQRSFDQERFLWELNFFKSYFIEQTDLIHLTKAEKEEFSKESILLSEYLDSLPKVFVHRDFHSRNLMFKNEKIALIDFQDARLGPLAYDFVSLIFDSYVSLPIEMRLKLIEQAITVTEKKSSESAIELKTSWAPTLLQRQLKAIGSFAYLTNAKKRGNYLYYLPEASKTLLSDQIKDHRWPFLSHDLPKRIHESSLPTKIRQ